MRRALNPTWTLTLIFVGLISFPAVVQVSVECARHQPVHVFDLFTRTPTALNLHTYEKSLEESSYVAAQVRPWIQYAQFNLLHEAGDKALVGEDGWLFYKPGVEYLTRRPPPAALAKPPPDPLPAIVSFRDQLAARGIRLLLLPMPNKESVYPGKLASSAAGFDTVVCPETRALLDRLEAARVDVLDLFNLFGTAKRMNASGSLYLTQDSHWSPAGVQSAATAVANWLVERGGFARGGVDFTVKPVAVLRHGDVLRMLQAPVIERHTLPESMVCTQVFAADGQPFRASAEADLLVLGDSFLRIYESDEPGAAGFIAHLARELRQPVSAIVNDGGASTLVRQELFRRPTLLQSKKFVLWEFVERDIRLGTEGWQIIPLPPDARLGKPGQERLEKSSR